VSRYVPTVEVTRTGRVTYFLRVYGGVRGGDWGTAFTRWGAERKARRLLAKALRHEGYRSTDTFTVTAAVDKEPKP
jgi:hypothetical protein